MQSEKIDEGTLVACHTPLVVSIALRYRPIPPNDKEDLISVGMIGLIKAIRSYDESLGFEFSTLATKAIHNEIRRELQRVSTHKLHDTIENQELLSPESIHIQDYLPGNLTEVEKTLLSLRFYLGETFEEIGDRYNRTKQWADMKIKSIIRKIQEANEKAKNTSSK